MSEWSLGGWLVWFLNPLTAGSDFFKSDGDPFQQLCCCLCSVFVLSSSYPPTDLCKKNCRSQGTWAFFGTWRQALSFVSDFFHFHNHYQCSGYSDGDPFIFIFIFCFTSPHHCTAGFHHAVLFFSFFLYLLFPPPSYYCDVKCGALYIIKVILPPCQSDNPFVFQTNWICLILNSSHCSSLSDNISSAFCHLTSVIILSN